MNMKQELRKGWCLHSMYIKAILEVNEDKLDEMDSTFETEMGWVEQSGIYLQSYEEVDVMDLLNERGM